VRFWDASAIVPLLVAESSTRRLQTLAAEDSAILVWWGCEVECVSALARLEREGAFNEAAMTAALARLR
jgi:predicted nucleic acid-binding protein